MLRRLYKLSLLSGLILSAPLIFGTGWYAWSTFAVIDRYRRAIDPERELDAEFFQIALHDELHRDLLRLTSPERDPSSKMPLISLSLSRSDLDALSAKGSAEGADSYVKGLLEKDGKVHEMRVRYRGDQPWHALGAQKSMKIRLDKGDLLDGARVFNLINDPTPFGMEDQLILELARESGLLAPEYQPVRVRLNNHDLGVFRFETQPDETLLRRSGRMPGNMYSGDAEATDPERQAGALFFNSQGWRKTASRSEEQEADMSELARLLEAINHGSHRTFAAYAAEELDLERYAIFDALDVVFGGSEHDYFSNHKLYADPYRGKLEPVAWSFRGFQHEETFNVVDHPFLIRLKMTPGYLALRDRKVYELLTGKASVPAIRERADRAAEVLISELAADPYWDAYKLLPRATRFHRFFSRPMTLDRWVLAAAFELDGFAARSRYLLDALEAPELASVRGPIEQGVMRIDLTVSGRAAYTVKSVRTRAACTGPLELYADADLDGRFDRAKDALVASGAHGESTELTGHRSLAAAIELIPHPDPHPKRGRVRATPAPERYTYFAVVGDCPIEQIGFELENVVAGSSALELVAPGSFVDPAKPPADPGAVPKLLLGERSAHPWSFPQPSAPRTIAFGPGAVRFEASRTFAANETVEFAAGSTLELGPAVSLIFHGPVFARGTAANAITFRRLDPERAFGGLALQGPRTAGSRLSGIEISGGTHARARAVAYPGLINIHDTEDIELEDWTVSGGGDNEDVLHVNRVDRLALHELTVVGAAVDAIDLEMVRGDARGLRIFHAGDDCLDLMTAELSLRDSAIIGCTNNAISAGEETVITANSILIADSKTGVLAKNASEARILRSLLYRTGNGLRAKRNEVRYAGASRIGLSEVHVVRAEVVHDADRGSTIELGELRVDMPIDRELTRVLEQVLGLENWSELDGFLERPEGRASL